MKLFRAALPIVLSLMLGNTALAEDTTTESSDTDEIVDLSSFTTDAAPMSARDRARLALLMLAASLQGEGVIVSD